MVRPLADEALEDAVSDSAAIRNFVSIDLGREEAPDATTVLKFRRLLEANALTERLFAEINAHLCERGLMMREGTMVDATIINARSSPYAQRNGRSARRSSIAWVFYAADDDADDLTYR